MQASNFGDTFALLYLRIFYALFTEDASQFFIYLGAKIKITMPKTQIKGSCLKLYRGVVCVSAAGSFQISDLQWARDFSCEGLGGDAAARFAADVCGLFPQIRVCVFILDLFVMSVVVWKDGKSEIERLERSSMGSVWASPRSRTLLRMVLTAQQPGDFAANMVGLCH